MLSPIRQKKDTSDHTSITQISQTQYHSITCAPETVEKATEVAKYSIQMLENPQFKDV